MKKKYIQLAVAAVLLIGMVSALILLRKAPEKPAESTDPEKEAVYVVGGADAAAPKSIAVKNDSSEYTVLPGEKPTIKGYESLSLNEYSLQGIIAAAQALPAKEVIAENASASDLDVYGLNAYSAQASITGADGKTVGVLFGNNAPGGEGVYVKRDAPDDNTVYLVSSSSSEHFFKPDTSYINLSITVADPEYKGFDKIIFTGADYPEPVVIEKTPENAIEAAGMTLNAYSMTSPFARNVDYNAIDNLGSLYGLTGTSIVAVGDDGATLEKYGLKDPPIAVSVTGSGGDSEMSFALKISAVTPEGTVRVVKSGSPVIYELAADTLPFLGKSAFDMMDKLAVMPFIDNVSRVTVTTPVKDYIFNLTGEGDEIAVTLNGKELSGNIEKPDGGKVTAVSNFKQYYQTLLCAKFEEQTDEAPPEGAVPILTIRYEYKDGGNPETISLYNGPTRRAFIRLNDGEWYLTPAVYVDRVFSDAADVENNKYVKSYL